MEENEKFGTIIVDGKVINLDTSKVEELKKLEEKLKVKVEEKKEKIKKNLLEDFEL